MNFPGRQVSSIKALRLYHERGLLMPGRASENSGYRYYRLESLEKARTIAQLRAMTLYYDDEYKEEKHRNSITDSRSV